jgi:hypothetical protein
VQINYGIKTGYNDAFIIDEDTKIQLLKDSPESAEIIRPILRGKDLKRYNIVDPKLWLIFSRHGTDIERYPSVKTHLQHFYQGLKHKEKGEDVGRKYGNYKWYEIQDNVAFYQELEKPKIVWGNLNNKPSFALDYSGRLISSPSVILIPSKGDETYLLAILNSSICHFFINQLGYARENNYVEYQKQFIEQLPVPKLDNLNKDKITELVQSILRSREVGLDSSKTEDELDCAVFKLYNLNTEEEIYIQNISQASIC